MQEIEKQLENLLQENMDLVEENKEFIAQLMALMGQTVAKEIGENLPGFDAGEMADIDKQVTATILAEAEVAE